MVFTVMYLDGPCAHRVVKIEMGAHPYPTLVCGVTTYVFRGSQAAGPEPSEVGPLYYVQLGGRLDVSGTALRGETDLFRAWTRLHYALNRTVGQQVRLIGHARRRIRRAVR